MQSVPITNNVASSNPAHGEVFSIQYYHDVIKFLSDLWQVSGFLWGTLVSSTNKTGDRFTKVIVNRKSKITLTISLRARICAFH